MANNTTRETDMDTVIEPEVVVPEVIVSVAKREGLTDQTSGALIKSFAPFHAQIIAALDAGKGVTDGANPTHQKIARACRLELRRVRCNIEEVRKSSKADALRYGKAVDGMANVLKFLCEPEESRLESIERYSERLAAERLSALIAARTATMQSIGCDPAMYNLGAMDEQTFDDAVATAKRIKEEKDEAERKAEQARIAKEKAEAEERARIRVENERLKAEAAAREKAQAEERRKAAEETKRIENERKKERAEAEAKMMAERKAREKAQAEADAIKAKHDAAQAKAKADAKAKERAERKAKNAPDKDKIIAFAATVSNLVVPTLSTDIGKEIAKEIQTKTTAFAKWITGKADTMEGSE